MLGKIVMKVPTAAYVDFQSNINGPPWRSNGGLALLCKPALHLSETLCSLVHSNVSIGFALWQSGTRQCQQRLNPDQVCDAAGTSLALG